MNWLEGAWPSRPRGDVCQTCQSRYFVIMDNEYAGRRNAKHKPIGCRLGAAVRVGTAEKVPAYRLKLLVLSDVEVSSHSGDAGRQTRSNRQMPPNNISGGNDEKFRRNGSRENACSRPPEDGSSVRGVEQKSDDAWENTPTASEKRATSFAVALPASWVPAEPVVTRPWQIDATRRHRRRSPVQRSLS